jgi:glycosyltransferase involved in cell wall biosynthesis
VKPSVSIIVPAYNKASYIEKTILSVLNQTLGALEVIVVDDFSSDGTLEIARRLSDSDSRVKIVAGTANKGANYCRNKGIVSALGDYIIFLDADDVLSPACCEVRLKQMRLRPDLDFAVFTMEIFSEKPGDRSFRWIPASKTPLDDFLRHKLPWQTMQPVWKTSFLRNIKGFDESFERMQDVEFHTRVLLSKPVFLMFQGEPDCFFRIAQDRLNFSGFVFMQKWVTSAIKYCDKFSSAISRKKRKLIRGTMYEALVNLTVFFRKKELTPDQFTYLQNILLNSGCLNAASRMIMRLSTIYNRDFARLPGINKVLKGLLVRV